MLIRLLGLVLILAGLALSYFGWRESSRIREIENEEEWEDAVYGPGGEAWGYGLAYGAILIFVGILLLLRVL